MYDAHAEDNKYNKEKGTVLNTQGAVDCSYLQQGHRQNHLYWNLGATAGKPH